MTQLVVRPRMRPLFEIELHDIAAEQVLRQLASQLREGDAPVAGSILTRKAELTTSAPACHAWSPWLSLQFEETSAGTQLLSGRFAPHPNVWTGFVAAYGVLLMTAIFGTMLGVSQWTLHTPPWGFFAPPIALAAAALFYVAAIIGQRLGADEMHALRDFVDRAVDDARAVATQPRFACGAS